MTGDISVYVVNLSTDTNPRTYLYFQWIDPVTGKRRSRSSKCTTKRDAERAAKAFQDNLNSSRPTANGSMPWEEFVRLFTSEHLSSMSQVSADRFTSILNVFEEFTDPQRLRSITAAVLTDYAVKLRESGRAESTISAHFERLKTALRWAVDNGYLAEVPRMPKITQSRTRAKGRPLTNVEFVKMLRATSSVVGRSGARHWRRLMIGLWLSGLRLDEALSLTWNDGIEHGSTIWIVTSGKRPLLGVVAESEKGRQDRLLPLTPDFAKWVLSHTPQHLRTGFVFPLAKQRHADIRRMDYASKVICEIGEKSGVKVNATGKFASAHDLRRSFGLRWAQKVFPAELQQLMRHADISTTMKFYALMEAENFAERLWNLEQKPDTTENTTPPKKG